ncbi:MAG: recombination mediator RecR [bacterium]
MNRIPEPLQKVVAAFSKLPGVGPKTALRYAYFLLSREPYEAEQMARAFLNLHAGMTRCRFCHLDSEKSPCEFCMAENRDDHQICVVAYSRDVHAIETSGSYKGRYHVVGGHLDALEGVTPEYLNIGSLLNRLREGNITEVILAFNPDITGEATSMYLARAVKQFPVRITKLARGLQTGTDLEYADPLTLGDALEGRREVK